MIKVKEPTVIRSRTGRIMRNPSRKHTVRDPSSKVIDQPPFLCGSAHRLLDITPDRAREKRFEELIVIITTVAARAPRRITVSIHGYRSVVGRFMFRIYKIYMDWQCLEWVCRAARLPPAHPPTDNAHLSGSVSRRERVRR